jgi:putative ABC transport system substrate-binding protein
VAVLHGEAAAFHESQRAAEVLHVAVHPIRVTSAADLDDGLHAARHWGADGLVFESHSLFAGAGQRLADFTIEHRLPGMSGLGVFVQAGGLMHYGPRTQANFRRAASYVDRILKGARPADLPIEQPREFDFAINLRTAQTLGLTIPQHILLQATEVLQ